jgi:hypothetical protein
MPKCVIYGTKKGGVFAKVYKTTTSVKRSIAALKGKAKPLQMLDVKPSKNIQRRVDRRW